MIVDPAQQIAVGVLISILSSAFAGWASAMFTLAKIGEKVNQQGEWQKEHNTLHAELRAEQERSRDHFHRTLERAHDRIDELQQRVRG